MEPKKPESGPPSKPSPDAGPCAVPCSLEEILAPLLSQWDLVFEPVILDSWFLVRTFMSSSPSAIAVGLALLGVAAGGYLLAAPSAQERAVRHLPTPSGRVFVTLSLMLKHGARIYDWIWENSVRFEGKPWRLQLVGRPVTVVFSTVEAVEDILKTQFEIFVKGPFTSLVAYDILGKGIFVADGELWSHQRKTASNLFSLQMMRDIMEESVRTYCAMLCDQLEEIASRDAGGNVVEIKRLLDLFTMDVFTKIGFGVDVGGLRGDETKHFLDAFERASLALLYRFQQPPWLWKLKKTFNIGVEKQLKFDMAVINDKINGIIAKCIEDRQSKGESNRRDLVGLFLDKEPPESLSDVDEYTALVRDMALNFIAAGRDTTSQSMSWFLLMMNRYPDVLKRVLHEIDTKAPSLRQQKTIPSTQDIQDLVFLEAAIKESMRLNPVVAITTRTANTDTTLTDGTFLKAGTRVVFSNYSMARMSSVWGEDAQVYNPDRWIEPTTGKLIQVSPFKNPVFLAGPRTCLGMKFAMMEMKITLASLLSRFELKTVKDPFKFGYRAAATMGVRGPLEIRVKTRES